MTVVVVMIASSLVLLIGIHLWPVDSLHVLPERRGVGVLLYTTGNFANVGLFVRVCPVLMFGPIAGVGERFGTARKLTHIGLLSRVRPQVCLQVLQT